MSGWKSDEVIEYGEIGRCAFAFGATEWNSPEKVDTDRAVMRACLLVNSIASKVGKIRQERSFPMSCGGGASYRNFLDS